MQGLEWGLALNASVVSSSVGYNEWWIYPDMDGMTAKTSVALDEAVRRNVVVVQAAGNRGAEGLDAPADAHLVITVGAIAFNSFPLQFSAQGPTFDGRTKVRGV